MQQEPPPGGGGGGSAAAAAPSLATAPKWTSQEAVAEYLARWQVEEAVQQAVNSAIRLKAADPVLHVAGFLEARGRVMEEQANAAAAAAAAAANSNATRAAEPGRRDS